MTNNMVGMFRKAHLPSRKLLEQTQKIEKMWGHCLTGTIQLHPDNWYNKVRTWGGSVSLLLLLIYWVMPSSFF